MRYWNTPKKKKSFRIEKLEIHEGFIAYVKKLIKEKKHSIEATVVYAKKHPEYTNIKTLSPSTTRSYINTNRTIIEKDCINPYRKKRENVKF